MSTSCRHVCCDHRDDPHHGHFLEPELCPRCRAINEPEPDADAGGDR